MRENDEAFRRQHALIRREFDRARAYALEYRGQDEQARFFNLRIQRVSELLGDFQRGRLLDIGCGPAVIGGIFRGKHVVYHGVDLSPAMIEFCRESYKGDPRYEFSVQEIERLAFADASFDVVLCLGVLEYLLDQPGAVRESARVLKPGGVMIATMLNKTSPYELYERYVHGRASWVIRTVKLTLNRNSGRVRERAPRSEKPFTRLLARKSFSNLLRSVGLEIEEAFSYDIRLIPPPWDSRFPRASVWISRHLECLGRSKLENLGRGLIVKGRKPGTCRSRPGPRDEFPRA